VAQPRIGIEGTDERCPLEEDAGNASRGQATTEVGREIGDRAVTDHGRSVPEPHAPKDVLRHGVRPGLHRPEHDRDDGMVGRERFEPRPIAGRELAGVWRLVRT
jgi:hypothetical protein